MREGARRVGEGEDAAEHLVRAEGVRDPMLAEDFQRRRRLEGVEHVGGGAGCDEAEQARHAERAAERQHRQQRMTLRGKLECLGDGEGVRGERPLRMRDQFGSFGRARCGVEQHGEIDVVLGGSRRIGLVERIEAHARPLRGDRIRADHRELSQRGDISLGDVGENGSEIDRAERRLDHQQLGTRQFQEMRDFSTAVTRIDGGNDRTQPGGSEQQRDPFDPVDQPDRDHVALADTLRREPGRGLLDHPRKLRARDGRAVEHEGGTGFRSDQRMQ